MGSEDEQYDEQSDSTASTPRGPFFYLGSWTLIWLGQWWLAPTWLIDSRSGLQTVLQVLPAVVVAVFVLVLGSLFVLGQQAVALHGARAPLLLPFNRRVRAAVLRPLLLTAVALLISGQVPDSGDPSEAATAAAATLVLAAIGVLAFSAPALQVLFAEFTAPVVFAQQVLASVGSFLRRGQTGYVVFRVGLLTEMLGQAVQRGDSRSIHAALSGIRLLHEQYIAAAQANPEVRKHAYSEGSTSAWFANEVPGGLVAAASDGISTAKASEEDVDAIIDLIGLIGGRSAEVDHREETAAAIDALMQLATCVHQVQPSGAVNHPSRTLTVLAQIEAAAERNRDGEGARRAIAGMVLASAYLETRWQVENPGYPIALRLLGENPPFYEAGDLVESREWFERWSYKLPPTPFGVIACVGWIQRMAEEHAALHGKPRPSPSPKAEEPWWMHGMSQQELEALIAKKMDDERGP